MRDKRITEGNEITKLTIRFEIRSIREYLMKIFIENYVM